MKEEINVKGCTYEDICAIIDNWMDYYNKDHYKDYYQQDLQKLSPNEYYEWLIKGIWSIVDSAPVPRSLPFLFSKVIASLKRKTKAVILAASRFGKPVYRSGRTPVLPYPERGQKQLKIRIRKII